MNPWTFKLLTEISPAFVEKVTDAYATKHKAIPWDKLMQIDRVETLATMRKPRLKKNKVKVLGSKILKLFNTQ